jgi:hypothetical protein
VVLGGLAFGAVVILLGRRAEAQRQPPAPPTGPGGPGIPRRPTGPTSTVGPPRPVGPPGATRRITGSRDGEREQTEAEEPPRTLHRVV